MTPVDNTNVDALPEVDDLPHSAGHRCRCRPAWKAIWRQDLGSVAWVFCHRRVDGTAVDVAVRYE